MQSLQESIGRIPRLSHETFKIFLPFRQSFMFQLFQGIEYEIGSTVKYTAERKVVSLFGLWIKAPFVDVINKWSVFTLEILVASSAGKFYSYYF
jgi:hypothetical protein